MLLQLGGCDVAQANFIKGIHTEVAASEKSDHTPTTQCDLI